jgi:hypothetical protein
VLDEHVELFKRAFIEKEVDALARRQLPTLVLRFDAGAATALPGNLTAPLELFENFLHESPLAAEIAA